MRRYFIGVLLIVLFITNIQAQKSVADTQIAIGESLFAVAKEMAKISPPFDIIWTQVPSVQKEYETLLRRSFTNVPSGLTIDVLGQTHLGDMITIGDRTDQRIVAS